MPYAARSTRPLAAAIAAALLLAACHTARKAEEPVPAQEPGKTASPESQSLDRIEVAGSRIADARSRREMHPRAAPAYAPPPAPPPASPAPWYPTEPLNRETYIAFDANPVQRVAEQPVSTFSIDVDTGSYTNIRRMLNGGQRPPADAVRVEEMINYFRYDYPAPRHAQQPFSVSTELAPAPWNEKRVLLQVGIQGMDVATADLPPANLVFLIDTSGSMAPDNRLPLVQRGLRLLVEQLRPQDSVAIVVYAGGTGVALPPTPGDRKAEIAAAIDGLRAAGATNGGAGIQLAYRMARQAFVEGGINRVILATDGDFNVGTTSRETLLTLVGDQRRSGISLTTLGVGYGNYNDAMLERLADAGNGNHAYLDNLREARKVLVEQMSGTLHTIASDVKVQVEFNPAVVAEYRLIGYENRVLRREDFDNDRVDAGEIGAGHSVTALYELALVGSGGEANAPLRYADPVPTAAGARSDEIALLRLRYKLPGEDDSRLIEAPIARSAIGEAPSENLRFAAAVAGFGDLLRGGAQVGDFGWNGVAELARGARGEDPMGHRGEFLQLVDLAATLTGGTPQVAVAD